MNLKSFPKVECSLYQQQILNLLDEKDDGQIAGRALMEAMLLTNPEKKAIIIEAIQNLMKQRIIEAFGEKSEFVKRVKAVITSPAPSFDYESIDKTAKF